MRTKTIGLIAHSGKPGVAKLARDVIREFQGRSLKVIVENETAKIAKTRARGTIAQVAQHSDLIVVLGGDGTLNEDPGYLATPDQMHLLPGAGEPWISMADRPL